MSVTSSSKGRARPNLIHSFRGLNGPAAWVVFTDLNLKWILLPSWLLLWMVRVPPRRGGGGAAGILSFYLLWKWGEAC